MITVLQVILDMRVEPTDKLCWSVGNQASARWLLEHGELPVSKLRSKKNGGGTHHHAHYPSGWRPIIEDMVRAHQTEASRQLGFDL